MRWDWLAADRSGVMAAGLVARPRDGGGWLARGMFGVPFGLRWFCWGGGFGLPCGSLIRLGLVFASGGGAWFDCTGLGGVRCFLLQVGLLVSAWSVGDWLVSFLRLGGVVVAADVVGTADVAGNADFMDDRSCGRLLLWTTDVAGQRAARLPGTHA